MGVGYPPLASIAGSEYPAAAVAAVAVVAAAAAVAEAGAWG
jgi:hypothetical protein